MKKTMITLFALAFALLLSACSGTPVKLGSPSATADQYDFSAGRKVSAEASGFQLLLFIPIDINDRQAQAYRSLQSQAGDGYITDVKVTESWTYALVGTIYTTQMDAMVYPKKK